MSSLEQQVAAYAAAVRAALADVPEADREVLLADLEDHLTEVAAETGPPAGADPTGVTTAAEAAEAAGAGSAAPAGERLIARLGPPDTYAAELRAAYGMDAPGRSKRSFNDLAGLLSPRGRAVLGRIGPVLLEFRQTWWLLRGYLLTALIWRVVHNGWGVVPSGIFDLALLVAVVAGSVALGMRARDGRLPSGRPVRVLLTLGNAAMVLLLFSLPAQAGIDLVTNAAFEPAVYAEPGRVPVEAGQGMADVVNIYPYSRDGKPLDGVLLYDQNGTPITLPYEQQGLVPDISCDAPPPIANAYPLRLRTMDDMMGDPGGMPEEPGVSSTSPFCASSSPSPVPHPPASGEPAPPTPAPPPPGSASVTATPSPTPSPTP